MYKYRALKNENFLFCLTYMPTQSGNKLLTWRSPLWSQNIEWVHAKCGRVAQSVVVEILNPCLCLKHVFARGSRDTQLAQRCWNVRVTPVAMIMDSAVHYFSSMSPLSVKSLIFYEQEDTYPLIPVCVLPWQKRCRFRVWSKWDLLWIA